MPERRPTFLDELKQRRVFRVAGAYVVAAWLALQFFDLVFDNTAAPDWAMQLVMAVAAVGFPVALVLAWAFQLTPAGVRLVPGRSCAFGLLVGAVSIVSVGYVVWTFVQPAAITPEMAPAGSDPDVRVIDSIAVLPFESFSEDRQDEYFADGLADTLLHKLAQLSNLKVIARNSSFQFKGSRQDAREIGEILDVAALLEGSVQRQGPQVRVIAQLIDTADGTQIWSSTFDDDFRNIFELQDRIAQAIMQQLQIAISERDRRLTLRSGTDSPEAYDLLMRALRTDDELNRTTFDPDSSRRLTLIDQALALDPDYAQAWEARSATFSGALFFSNEPERVRRYIAEATAAAENAIEAAPAYAGGHARLGWAYLRARNVGQAQANFIRALELDPRQLDAMTGLGLIKVFDDPEMALDLFTQARELDPQNSFVYRQLFFAYDALGRLDEGIEALKSGIERFPDESILKTDLATVYIYDLGRPDEAARLVSPVLEADSRDRLGLATMISVWVAARDADRTEGWLDTFAARFPESTLIAVHRAEILTMQGEAAAARVAIEAAAETPGFRFDRATAVGGPCLVLGDAACLEEQASDIVAWLEEYETSGREYAPAERYRMAAAVLANASRPAGERDVDGLQALADLSDGWPLTAGRGYRHTGYLRAMLLSLLGQDDAAVAELRRSLDFADTGFLYRDIFRLAPDRNPLVLRLAGTAGYDEWLEAFTGRREQTRGKLVQMERDGEILAAEDVVL